MTAMAMTGETASETLPQRVRAHLRHIAGRGTPITYKELADALAVTPPKSIHRVAEALEHLMREDAANGHPFIAALVISRARGGLPALGFFDTARRLRRFAGDLSGPEASAFHATALADAAAFWAAAPADRQNG